MTDHVITAEKLDAIQQFMEKQFNSDEPPKVGDEFEYQIPFKIYRINHFRSYWLVNCESTLGHKGEHQFQLSVQKQ